MGRQLGKYEWVELAAEDYDGKLDFAQVFGRSAPVHVEVGTGKGTFLVSQASAQPAVDFLGIEWARRYYRHAVDRIGRWDLRNVRLIRADAADLISHHIADASVDCFHVYFPDPWPKKRHHKRRLLNEQNTAHLVRCLKPGGIIRIATDFDEYFEQIMKVIAARPELDQIDFEPAAGAAHTEAVGTNYERKYMKDSRAISTLAVRKTREHS